MSTTSLSNSTGGQAFGLAAKSTIQWPPASDRSALITMWLVAGLLVTVADYTGRTLDSITASSPITNFVFFSVWALIGSMAGAASVQQPAAPRLLAFAGVHVVALSAVFLLSLHFYGNMAAIRPVRLPLILSRDMLIGLAAYATVGVSLALAGLTRRVDWSTRKEADLAAALRAEEVRRAGEPTLQLRQLLAETRQRLEESPEKAESFATATANLLRTRLEAGMSHRWTLRDEIRLLDRELDLDRERSSCRTRVAVDASAGVLDACIHPGSLVQFWRESRHSSTTGDQDVLIEGRRLNEAVAITLHVDGISSLDRFIPIAGTAGEPDTLSLARFGRWIVRHRRSATAAVVVTGVITGTAVIALHRASMVSIEWGWLSFMFLRSSLWISFAALLASFLNLRSLRQPVRIALLSVGSALAGEIVFAIFMHFVIWQQDSVSISIRKAAAMAFTSICHPTLLTLALSNAIVAIRNIGELVERAERLSAADARFRHAQLSALRWQVNPHLLFNTLNAAAALLRTDRSMAFRFLESLESFYARLSQRTETDFVPLREELELVREYLRIESVRFPNLRVSWAIQPDAEDEQVPALLLQPLIENAVKFGAPAPDIDIWALSDDKRWTAGVRSNVTDVRRGGAGAGLTILAERLRGHYGDAASIDCRREEGSNTTAVTVYRVKQTP